jgi:hypothetical protein
MKKLLYCCLFALLVGTAGCRPYTPGTGLYFYYPVADESSDFDTTMTPASFLELSADGSYTQDFGHFDYGSWMIQDRRLYLTNQRHRTYIYQITLLTPKELDVLLDAARIGHAKTGHFIVHTRPSANPEKDPFSKYNNQWRIPAIHPESDAEIRQRLLNHCRFWEVYLTWAKDHESGTIDVRSTPSPLKVYGNGFGLKHYTDLPAEWKSFFYDSVDCHKADTMIKHTFRRHEFVWPKTDDDIKKLISGTQQLQQWLSPK